MMILLNSLSWQILWEEKLKNYSSGMQVRLAFSVAIKARGDILMLD